MEYRRFGDTYVIRMDRGEEIVESLTGFCEKEGLLLGTVEAIGAADHAVVGLYDVETRKYGKAVFDEPMEIIHLGGNITEKDGKPYIHLHIALCNAQMQMIGGHLNECRISVTCEMAVRAVQGRVERALDEAVTGLNLYRFPD